MMSHTLLTIIKTSINAKQIEEAEPYLSTKVSHTLLTESPWLAGEDDEKDEGKKQHKE
jgi:hypothetical protein